MFLLIALIFLLTASLGAFLLSYFLMKKNTPKGIALIHGFLGALGLVLLIFFSIQHGLLAISAIIFTLAALGGFYIFIEDLLGKKQLTLFAIGHGTMAIIGFISLLAIYALYYYPH